MPSRRANSAVAQAVVGADGAARQDRPLAATAGVRREELELPRLVAAEGAVGPIVLDPGPCPASVRTQIGQLANRRRPLAELHAVQIDLELHGAVSLVAAVLTQPGRTATRPTRGHLKLSTPAEHRVSSFPDSGTETRRSATSQPPGPPSMPASGSLYAGAAESSG